MQLHRLVLSWSGPQVVGGGVSVLHYAGDTGTVPDLAALKSAVAGMATSLPSGVTVTVPNSGDVIEDTTGHLLDVWTGAGGGQVAGSAPAACAAGVGACISWYTGGIVVGKKGPRKLRGRTFVVPLSNQIYDADGTIAGVTLTQIDTFAQGIQNAGPLAVWHRPTTKGGSDGNSYGVISHRVHDRVAILTSRRD